MIRTAFMHSGKNLLLGALLLSVACNAPIETEGEPGAFEAATQEAELQMESETFESQDLVGAGCADGSAEQTFSGGMVGCSGRVTWANRATLCAQGYRLATAAEWVSLRGTTAPTHHYWTQDTLRYSGSGTSACSVSTTAGTACGQGQSMGVCTAQGRDPEGNNCNWGNCGLGANTPNQFFGGCVNTSGALCVPATPTTAGCADGTIEQTFSNGMVGCAGRVTWNNRASLCGANHRPATANEWSTLLNGVAPTHHYWTDDDLRYSGSGSGACSVSTTAGTYCGANTPMRVCSPTAGNDPEGNTCGWRNCGLGANTPNRYFGGCSGNTTAGTICVPRAAPTGCEDGSAEQTFSGGMVGCAGGVTWANRATLCAQGYRLATAAEWVNLRGTAAPTHHYWTQDNLRYSGSGTSACSVSTTAGNACGQGQSMGVCRAAGTDSEGNNCNWGNCGLGANTPNQYFGGCVNTSGALCVPVTAPASGCADGTVEQVFSANLVGCAGRVTWNNRGSLCAAGWSVSNAATWATRPGATAPSHHYWTDDDLRYSGSGSGACSVSPTTGTYCGANTPMRVCTAAGNDPEGNTCNWRNCGLGANTPNQYFGGCAGNTTAGTLCRR
ncbi:hypothetical protein LXT21_25960 [Myxococcus sp. K38C18041901]|uniref:hypothetical protein n=1 Tax=Myxococcus guangdongensis TaxID=2906760 RepID=UPI0020A6FD21|nr:hypothetical protein [Myxococcus guangdongensis]MCP3062239.1 hypothetical protein [Myxococcus guangdongensis]